MTIEQENGFLWIFDDDIEIVSAIKVSDIVGFWESEEANQEGWTYYAMECGEIHALDVAPAEFGLKLRDALRGVID